MNTSITMQAAVYETYGAPEVLQVKTVAKPTPKANELLIKIHAATVTSGDWHLRAADPFMARFFTGLFKPKNIILGHELAGVVEAVGANVTRFKVGDAVFGSTELDSGTYAEYKCLPESAPLALKPANLSFEEAAAIPVGAITALYFLQKGNLKAGDEVLVYGASGSVGTYAVQLAKYYGAKVTAVCSTSNLDMMRNLGADKVIDYTKEDFTQNGKKYNMIFDAVGKLSIPKSKKVLTADGCYITMAWGLALMGHMLMSSINGKQKIMSGMSKGSIEMITFLKERIEAGQLKAVIDKRYTLNDLPAAHRYVQSGRKKGNVVINIA